MQNRQARAHAFEAPSPPPAGGRVPPHDLDAEAAVLSAVLLERAPIDIVSVAGSLRDRERLAQVGGSAYLAQLVDSVPSVAHVDTYARMVKEKWRIRQLIVTCQRVAAEGYGDIG